MLDVFPNFCWCFSLFCVKKICFTKKTCLSLLTRGWIPPLSPQGLISHAMIWWWMGDVDVERYYSKGFLWFTPLVIQQFAMENITIEIVVIFPWNMVIFHSYVSLPEGISYFEVRWDSGCCRLSVWQILLLDTSYTSYITTDDSIATDHITYIAI